MLLVGPNVPGNDQIQRHRECGRVQEGNTARAPKAQRLQQRQQPDLVFNEELDDFLQNLSRYDGWLWERVQAGVPGSLCAAPGFSWWSVCIPSSMVKACGIMEITASSEVLAPFGLPGKFTIRDRPRVPET